MEQSMKFIGTIQIQTIEMQGLYDISNIFNTCTIQLFTGICKTNLYSKDHNNLS